MKARQGFSLTEILVALVLMGFISSALMQALRDFNRLFKKEQQSIEGGAEARNTLKIVQLDISQAGSDVSPRLTSSIDSPGFALGRLTSSLSARRGIMPLGTDSMQILNYRPYDANRDGTIAINEGCCTTATVNGSTFVSTQAACYPSGTETGSTASYVPLKLASRDNLKYFYADCNADGVKDCLKVQNLGDYRSSTDDQTAEILLQNVASMLITYVLDDGRVVFYNGNSGAFSDGTDNMIPASYRDMIRQVKISMAILQNGKNKNMTIIQRVATNI